VHPRCYGQQQDILDPQHYLPLLAQRPGAFNYAKPIREWRATWPAVYEQLLAELQQRQPGSRAIREFIRCCNCINSTRMSWLNRPSARRCSTTVPTPTGWNCACANCASPMSRAAAGFKEHPHLPAVQPPPVSLAHYNQLLPTGGHNDCQFAA
jgi:hypothetical protein